MTFTRFGNFFCRISFFALGWLSSSQHLFADATLHVRIFDKATNSPLPSKVYIEVPGGGSVPPASNPYMLDHGTAITYQHSQPYITARPYYFYSDDFTITVPAGITSIRCRHGFEYENKLTTVSVVDGVDQSVDILLERKIDLPALGWYSWDPHNHLNHGDSLSVVFPSAREGARISKASGLNFGFLTEPFNDYPNDFHPGAGDMNLINSLVAPETTRDFKALYNHEMAGNFMGGHLTAFFDENVTASSFSTSMARQGSYSPAPNPFPMTLVPTGSLTGAADVNHANGYLMFSEHSTFPIWGSGTPGKSPDVYGGMPGIIEFLFTGLMSPRVDGTWYGGFTGQGQARELPAAAALRKWDSIGLLPASVIAGGTIETWYHLLNCGIRLPPHAGVDNTMDRKAGGDPGGRRAYTYIQPGLDFTSPAAKPFAQLKQGILSGRTFVTNGPLVFFTVNGAMPGDEISLTGATPQSVNISVNVQSFGDPFNRVELVSNGQVIQNLYSSDSAPIDNFTANTTVTIADSSWLAIRVRGNTFNYWNSNVARPFHSAYPDPVGTTFWGALFAHTNAVFVRVNGKRIWNQTSANYFIDWLTRLRNYQTWIRSDAPSWGLLYTDAAYNEYVGNIDLALDFYNGMPGKLQFSTASYVVGENATSAQITVRRTGGSAGPASIEYSTADDTATAGSDYTAVSGTLSWQDGDVSDRIVSIPIRDDTVVEGAERLRVVLSNAIGASVGDPVNVTLTITDNDQGAPAGLMSHWRFDEGMGATAADSGNSTNSASLNPAAAWTAGRYGSGINFAASGSYVSAGLTGFNFTEGTIAFWYKPNYSTNNTAGVSHEIVNVGPYTYTAGSIRIYNNREYQDIRITHNGAGADILSGTDLLANQWYHIVYTWNSTTGTKKYYLNAALDKTASVAAWTPSVAPRQVYLGKSADSAAGANGSLDDVRIYSYALSSAEVQNLYSQNPGTLKLSAATYSADEDAGVATITVSRVNGASGPASVRYVTSNGTALAGQDYTITTGTLSWTDGDAADKTITIPVTSDGTAEPDETLNLTLSNAVGAALGSPAAAVVTILDKTPGTLKLTADAYSVHKEAGTCTITVSRVNGATGPVSVNYATSDGTAVAGKDYTAAVGTLSWADRETADKTFAIHVTPTAAPDTSLNVTLTDASGAALGSPASAVVTIDERTPGTLKFTAGTYSVNEDAGTVTITVSRAGGASGAASVNYAASNGTALSGQDYTAVSGSLSWADGDAADKTFSVPIAADGSPEPSETFNVALTGAMGATLGSPVTAVVTILDRTPGSVKFSAGTYSVNEDAGTVTITVSRVNGSSGDARVTYATADGTAVAGQDYTATTGTILWADGDTADKTFTVPITSDALPEPGESLSVTLSAAAGAALGSPATAVVTIVDRTPGSLHFSTGSYSAHKDAGTVTISVSRAMGAAGAASISYATSDGTALANRDYAAATGTLSWADGDAADKTFTVSILPGASSQTAFTVALSAPAGAALGSPATATVTILDSTSGSLRFTTGNYSVNEDAGTVTISVSRVNGSMGAAAVTYAATNGTAVAGQDYTAVSGTLSWADGDSTDKTFVIPVTNDGLPEASETFNVTLSNATGAAVGSPASALVTILDRTPGSLRFSAGTYSVTEDGGAAVITVSRVNGASGAASVNYATSNGTALAGQDYTSAGGTLSWADGETADKTFTIPVTNDGLAETNETFEVSLSNASGAVLGSSASAVVNILDRTPGILKFSTATYSVSEDAAVVTISVARVNGASGPASVNYATSDGTAVAGQDYTATSGTLSWADGDTSVKSFSVAITDDDLLESNETINLTLTNASGASAGDPVAAVLTIADNDSRIISGLVSYWKFDEGTGVTAADSGTRTNNGSVMGGSAWTTGRFGSGLEFRNPGSYVSASTAGFNFREGSIAFWYKPNYSTNNTAGVTHEILNVGPYTYTPGNIRIFNNREYQDIRIVHNGGGADLLSTTDLLANQWYHIVYTWNSATGSKKYYLNSALNSSLAVSSWTAPSVATQVYLGKTADSAAVANGTLDEVRIYNFALSAAEVQNLYAQNPGTLKFSTATYSVNEDAGTAVVTVSRINGASGAVTVNYATSDGTALAGQDYTAVSGTLSWADGDTADKTFTIPIAHDGSPEPSETLNVTLSSVTGAALGTPASAVVTINDRTAGSVKFSSGAYALHKNLGAVTIAVSRVNGSSGAASVTFATSDGTALAGRDYAAATGTLTWADGDSADKTFTIDALAGASPSGTLNVTLSNPVGVILASPATAVVTIDDTTPGSLRLSMAAYSVNEDAGSVSVTVSRVNGATGAATVSYTTSNGTAAAGQDYTAVNGTLSWADGDSTDKTFTIPITNDGVSETSETLNVTLSNATGAPLGSPATAVITILDRTPGNVRFSTGTYSVAEDSGALTVTVSRVGGGSGAASVSYATSNGTATAGQDYVSVSGTLSWADGDTADKTFLIPVTNDGVAESSETLNVTLSNATGATLGSPAAAVVTILDRTPGTLRFSTGAWAVNEDAGTVTITVARVGGSSGAAGVSYATSNGTATAGQDYTATAGTLSWVDGDSSVRTFSIPIADDTLLEANETINIVLSNATGASAGDPVTAVVTIVDNDYRPPSGLVSYWKFDEGAGTTTRDSGNSTNNASVVGAAGWTSGRFGAALEFKNPGAYVSAGTSGFNAREGSIAFWYKPNYSTNNTAGVTHEIVTVGPYTYTPGNIRIFNNREYQDVRITHNGGGTDVLSGTDLLANQWYHIVYTWNSATGAKKYYLNSALNSSQTVAAWTPPASVPPQVSIGKTADSAAIANGTIDDVRIYSYALSLAEVQNLFQQNPGTLKFGSPAYSVNEDAGTVTITVSRVGGSSGPAGVNYATADGTALAGSDYTPVAGTLSWADGDMADKTFTIPVTNDAVAEPDETLNLVLSNATGAAIGSPAGAAVTIVDVPPVSSKPATQTLRR